MSIIVEGIDLPKNKDEYTIIRIYGNGRTWADKTLVGQAIQIDRPHGRLIDADKYLYYGDLVDEPTILESEEDE